MTPPSTSCHAQRIAGMAGGCQALRAPALHLLHSGDLGCGSGALERDAVAALDARRAREVGRQQVDLLDLQLGQRVGVEAEAAVVGREEQDAVGREQRAAARSSATWSRCTSRVPSMRFEFEKVGGSRKMRS